MDSQVKQGYKQTEVGLIPEDWLEFSIGDLIEFEGGSQPNKIHFSQSWKPNYVRLIQIRDYKTDRFLTFIPENLARRFCEEDEIMIGRYGPPIFQILRGIKGAYNVALMKAKPTQKINKTYAYYYLKQTKLFAFIEKLSQRSSGQTGVDIDELKKYPLPLPPSIAEQEKIAEALSDVDSLIESLEELIAKKRHIKQGAMQELLTGKRRLINNEEWIIDKLGNFGTFLKGSGVKKDECLSGNLPCIRYGEIYTKHNDNIKGFFSWVSSEVANSAVKLKKGDLLFAGSGETKEEIGKCVAFLDDIEAYAGGDIVILRLHKDCDSCYLGYYLNTAPINKQKASKGQGDAVVHISASALSSLEVRIPPTKAEQEAIAEVLTDMDNEITALEEKLQKTRHLKQGMMQELLTGKTRLI